MTAVNLNRAIRGPVTAVPVVAGKGVRLVADTVNNRFVVEADETVLWEDANGKKPSVTGDFPITLSEAISNFETVKFYWHTFTETYQNHTVSEKMTDDTSFTLEGCTYNSSLDSAFTFIWVLTTSGTTLSHAICKYNNWANNNVQGGALYVSLYKVVGINRKAST